MTRKFAALGLVLLFAAGMTAATYPDFFRGPWPHLDPVIAAWHSQIAEIQPLVSFSLAGVAAFLTQMTGPVLSLPLIVQRLRRGPDADRPVMLLSLFGFVLFKSRTRHERNFDHGSSTLPSDSNEIHEDKKE